MTDHSITVPELLLLLLIFGGPIYVAGSAVVLAILARRRPPLRLPLSRASLITRGWLLVVPLTLVVWWAMAFVPEGWMDALIPGPDWAAFAVTVGLPAVIASTLGFGVLTWWAIRAGSRPAS